MELVAHSMHQIDLPDGEYNGTILNDSIPICDIFLDRDNNIRFIFENINSISLTKGVCIVKVIKKHAVIYIKHD